MLKELGTDWQDSPDRQLLSAKWLVRAQCHPAGLAFFHAEAQVRPYNMAGLAVEPPIEPEATVYLHKAGRGRVLQAAHL